MAKPKFFKILSTIPAKTVEDVLDGAHIGYWGIFTGRGGGYVNKKDPHAYVTLGLEAQQGSPPKGSIGKHVYKLDIQRGLELMADNYPEQFALLVDPENLNADGNTGDLLVQLAAFEDTIYG